MDVPEQVQYGQVSADFFRVFSIPIAQGRGFSAEEDRPSGPHVAVISDELRQRRFGGDPNIVGKTISLSSVTYEVIGVVAPGYRTEANPPAEVWTPFQIDPQSKDQAHYFTTVGAAQTRCLVRGGQREAHSYPARDSVSSIRGRSRRNRPSACA